MKRIVFWIRCLKVVWNERRSKSGRNKDRRLYREFRKISDNMSLSK
jgi:hypothetical protein